MSEVKLEENVEVKPEENVEENVEEKPEGVKTDVNESKSEDNDSSPTANASSDTQTSANAFTVHVKIGKDNSVQILDSKPQQPLETKKFVDIISSERQDDVYIAISVNKSSCLDDDSCIEYGGENYKMDL
jgi:hypothetical protein